MLLDRWGSRSTERWCDGSKVTQQAGSRTEPVAGLATAHITLRMLAVLEASGAR